MRLFVAIAIAPEIRERITRFEESLKAKIPDARWSGAEALHITLKFLGQVADDRLGEIQSALARTKAPRFPLAVEGVGIFPNVKFPRVLWAGVKAGAELAQLAEKIDLAMSRLGFETERRAFSPHVTLARLKESHKKTALSSLPEDRPSFGTMTVKDFHLYESKLSPQGSRYIQLARFVLE